MFYTTYYIRVHELKGFDLWSKEDYEEYAFSVEYGSLPSSP